MRDSNWELVNGEAAHEIEYINFSNQVNVIEALVILFTANWGGENQGCPAAPGATVLRELHRTGTLFLLAAPGDYRHNYNVNVYRPDGSIVYTPPPWEEVAGHMAAFDKEIMDLWPREDAIGVASYALWRLNWIHPFKNGNGRSARAYAYACLCLKAGAFLPGTPTVLDQIMTNRPPYEAALRAADIAFEKTGVADLTDMKTYLLGLLTTQLGTLSGDGSSENDALAS